MFSGICFLRRSKVNFVAQVCSGNPTVFLSSFDFLRLLFSLLFFKCQPEVRGISLSAAFGLAIHLMYKLISYSNHSVFVDKDY